MEGCTLFLFFDFLICWTLNVGGVILEHVDEGNIIRTKEQLDRRSLSAHTLGDATPALGCYVERNLYLV